MQTGQSPGTSVLSVPTSRHCRNWLLARIASQAHRPCRKLLTASYLPNELRQRCLKLCASETDQDAYTEEELEYMEQLALSGQTSTSSMRPWTFLIPSMDEVAESKNWHTKVADWKMFWAMFNNWLWAYQQLVYLEEEKRAPDPDTEEQMDWLQISPEIQAGRVGKLVRVIDSVMDSIRDLRSMGYPVPSEIAGKFPGFTGSKSRNYKVDDTGSKYIDYGKVEGNMPMWDATTPTENKQDDTQYSDMSRPWDNWDEWEHRVYMEKQRQHRQRQAKFAKKQAEIGKWKHLVVSPTTDSRWAEDSYFYPINERDYTHEEIMQTVRLKGKAMDPLEIPIVVVDPDSHADGFQEGVHWVPDTIDYVREIGHLVEREEELIGERDSNLPSATLDEEFADSGDSPLDELDSPGFDADSMEPVPEAEEMADDM